MAAPGEQRQINKGIPPATGTNPPGADFGTNVLEPRQAGDLVDPSEKQMRDQQHLSADKPAQQFGGEYPSYLGFSGDRLIWAITFFATLGFSVRAIPIDFFGF